MKFTMTFDMNNSAFDGVPLEETSRIFRKVSTQMLDGDLNGIVHDINGNKIGQWSIDQE